MPCGNFISIGSIEPQFYALLRHAGSIGDRLRRADGPQAWPELKAKLTEVFKTKTRDDWCKIMEGTDICFAPMLTMAEAPKHPHIGARDFVEPRRHPAGAGAALLPHAVRDSAPAGAPGEQPKKRWRLGLCHAELEQPRSMCAHRKAGSDACATVRPGARRAPTLSDLTPSPSICSCGTIPWCSGSCKIRCGGTPIASCS